MINKSILWVVMLNGSIVFSGSYDACQDVFAHYSKHVVPFMFSRYSLVAGEYHQGAACDVLR